MPLFSYPGDTPKTTPTFPNLDTNPNIVTDPPNLNTTPPPAGAGDNNINVFNTPPPANLGGKTVVSTDALKQFGTSMNTLAAFVGNLMPPLTNIQVQPGDFYQADEMRTAFNYASGSSALSYKYYQVLDSLQKGLADMSAGATNLALKYQTAEDLNKATSDDVQNLFGSAGTDFNTMFQNAGGNGGGSNTSSNSDTTPNTSGNTNSNS
jgi:hypothetical protein